MRLNKRVERLERAVGITGVCPICGGLGLGRIVFRINGVDTSPQDPAGCRGCGQSRVVRRFIIDEIDAEKAAVVCALGRCAPPAPNTAPWQAAS